MVIMLRPPVGNGVKYHNLYFLSVFLMLSYLNRSTLSVIAAYLDAFQKIADSATNTKGNIIFHLLKIGLIF